MIILASNSPRRKKLLEDAGVEFKVVALNVDETTEEKMRPDKLVTFLARKKAKAVFDLHNEDIIIAADTVVVYEGDVLGKPVDEDDAYRMLKMLSGNHHEVYTGVCIMSKDKEVCFNTMAEVWMNHYNDLQIYEYIKTREPMDKAGAYAIQGLGKELVLQYNGDFFTIVGLPLKQLLTELKAFK
ncbi:MAG: Maf family protein [Acholeplasma sp.]|nr:Maf family protein [Acholeplasma sp.]